MLFRSFWTILWGAAATVTCYAGGIIMATVLTQLKIRLISVFRSIYILPYAIPIVVSMMIWRNLLNGSFGIVKRTLLQLGLIDKSSMIPWLSDPTLAKIGKWKIKRWPRRSTMPITPFYPRPDTRWWYFC